MLSDTILIAIIGLGIEVVAAVATVAWLFGRLRSAVDSLAKSLDLHREQTTHSLDRLADSIDRLDGELDTQREAIARIQGQLQRHDLTINVDSPAQVKAAQPNDTKRST